MIENAFPCPHCGRGVVYSPATNQAMCLVHGMLLYTDIPPAVSFQHKRKPGWKTASEVIEEQQKKITEKVIKIFKG